MFGAGRGAVRAARFPIPYLLVAAAAAQRVSQAAAQHPPPSDGATSSAAFTYVALSDDPADGGGAAASAALAAAVETLARHARPGERVLVLTPANPGGGGGGGGGGGWTRCVALPRRAGAPSSTAAWAGGLHLGRGAGAELCAAEFSSLTSLSTGERSLTFTPAAADAGDTACVAYGQLLLLPTPPRPPLPPTVDGGGSGRFSVVTGAAEAVAARRALLPATPPLDAPSPLHMAVLGGSWPGVEAALRLVEVGGPTTLICGEPAPLTDALPRYLADGVMRRLRAVGRRSPGGRALVVEPFTTLQYAHAAHTGSEQPVHLFTCRTYDALQTSRTGAAGLLVAPPHEPSGWPLTPARPVAAAGGAEAAFTTRVIGGLCEGAGTSGPRAGQPLLQPLNGLEVDPSTRGLVVNAELGAAGGVWGGGGGITWPDPVLGRTRLVAVAQQQHGEAGEAATPRTTPPHSVLALAMAAATADDERPAVSHAEASARLAAGNMVAAAAARPSSPVTPPLRRYTHVPVTAHSLGAGVGVVAVEVGDASPLRYESHGYFWQPVGSAAAAAAAVAGSGTASGGVAKPEPPVPAPLQTGVVFYVARTAPTPQPAAPGESSSAIGGPPPPAYRVMGALLWDSRPPAAAGTGGGTAGEPPLPPGAHYVPGRLVPSAVAPSTARAVALVGRLMAATRAAPLHGDGDAVGDVLDAAARAVSAAAMPPPCSTTGSPAAKRVGAVEGRAGVGNAAEGGSGRAAAAAAAADDDDDDDPGAASVELLRPPAWKRAAAAARARASREGALRLTHIWLPPRVGAGGGGLH